MKNNGFSLIEAMACSKPVVATDVGGVRDTIKDAGILVKNRDSEAMARELLKLALSPMSREVLGRRGRDMVKNKYSKERLISDLEKLYKDSVLQKTGGKKA